MKNTRQTGPAIGQRYWIAHISRPGIHTYDAEPYDLEVCTNGSIYPEERFAEAERRARRLIAGVNKRRRELNEGKEFGDRSYYIEYWDIPGSINWESIRSKCAQGVAYPFGPFKDFADCEMCVREFEDGIKWFSEEYLPLMAELDDYDWADAPGWGEREVLRRKR